MRRGTKYCNLKSEATVQCRDRKGTFCNTAIMPNIRQSVIQQQFIPTDSSFLLPQTVSPAEQKKASEECED